MSSSSTFEILRGRKPPNKQNSSYPFTQMAIDDAFFIPCPPEEIDAFCRKAHNAARRFRAIHNPDFRITTRSQMHKGTSGIMIYRIA